MSVGQKFILLHTLLLQCHTSRFAKCQIHIKYNGSSTKRQTQIKWPNSYTTFIHCSFLFHTPFHYLKFSLNVS